MGTDRPDGPRGNGHPSANITLIGAGIAGLTLLALVPRQRAGGRWACVGLGSALVGGAVLGWARANGNQELRARRHVEGLQPTSPEDPAIDSALLPKTPIPPLPVRRRPAGDRQRPARTKAL